MVYQYNQYSLLQIKIQEYTQKHTNKKKHKGTKKQQKLRYQCHVGIGNYENTHIINKSINEVDFKSEDQSPIVRHIS